MSVYISQAKSDGVKAYQCENMGFRVPKSGLPVLSSIIDHVSTWMSTRPRSVEHRLWSFLLLCLRCWTPHRIHPSFPPKTPSGQPQKRCTFAFQHAAVVNARSGHGIHHIVFTNVCCLVLVFGGYMGGAGIVRCCVSPRSRMNVELSAEPGATWMGSAMIGRLFDLFLWQIAIAVPSGRS